jgi:hypothetical protein
VDVIVAARHVGCHVKRKGAGDSLIPSNGSWTLFTIWNLFTIQRIAIGQTLEGMNLDPAVLVVRRLLCIALPDNLVALSIQLDDVCPFRTTQNAAQVYPVERGLPDVDFVDDGSLL